MKNQKVRIVKVWRPNEAGHIYLLQEYCKSIFPISLFCKGWWNTICPYTYQIYTANKWAEHYGVKIQLVEDDEA